MVRIFHDDDVPPGALADERVAVIGYGNQGRSWALNLRDAGIDVAVGTVGDASRARASEEGFAATDIPDAVAGAQLVCLLFPDEVMAEVFPAAIAPGLRPGDAVCFASGYALAFEQLAVPAGVDVVCLAPRMLGVGVRETFLEGSGFVAFGAVEHDATGRAEARLLGLARGIGATRRGVIELGARAEALLDLFVEQAIAPALSKVWGDAALVLLEAGIPLEAVLVEFFLSGEVERAYRALREIGYARQQLLHSPTSQYGTLSRAARFADLDTAARMRAVLGEIDTGTFAAEWAEERATGYRAFERLKASDPRTLVTAFEDELREALRPR